MAAEAAEEEGVAVVVGAVGEAEGEAAEAEKPALPPAVSEVWA